MLRRMRALLALALFLVLAASARAQDGLVLNFRDAEIRDVIDLVARSTGQRFIFDSEIRGRVTIILEDEVSRDEALEVLNAALLMVGYATLPGPDGSWKILPIEAAKGAAPWMYGPASSESSRLVTTLVRLESADPTELAQILGQDTRASIVLPYPATNGLIIAASEDRLARMLDLVRALDQASATELAVFPLRYAEAQALAAQLEVVFKEGDAPDVPWRVIVEERTNSLVVQAARARIDAVRRFIALVDVPSRAPSGYHVVRIVNADAETVATHLQGLEFGAAQASGTARTNGARGAAAAGQPARAIEVVADVPTNSLIIRAPAGLFGEIAAVIAELDRIPPRVAIEAHVWEVQTARELELGFNALIPLKVGNDPDDTFAFATIGDTSGLLGSAQTTPFLARFTRRPLVIPVLGPDGETIDAIVPEGAAELIASDGRVSLRTLTSPYLLAASGEEQSIFAGDQVPIPVTTGVGATADDGTVTDPEDDNPFVTDLSIQRQDVGVELRVKPLAVSGDIVTLELHISVTSVAPSVTLLGSNAAESELQGPTIREFTVDANVRLTAGAVVVVASAPLDSMGKGETGVPFFKDIPILGWFFKSTRDIERRRRLVAAVQVNMIHTADQQRAESITRRLALERHFTRTNPLSDLIAAPYAVLVATRTSSEGADRVLADLRGLEGVPVVVPWTVDGTTQYDVYLAGFEEIAELGPLTVALRQLGFTTRLEVIGPPRT